MCRHLRVELCSAVVGVPKKPVKIQQVAVCWGDGRFGISDHETWDTANNGWQCHFHPSFWFKGCSRDASHVARPSTGVPSCLHLICCLTARLGEQSSRVQIHRIEAQRVFKSLLKILPLLVLLRGISFCQAFIKLMDVISFGRWVFYDHAS